MKSPAASTGNSRAAVKVPAAIVSGAVPGAVVIGGRSVSTGVGATGHSAPPVAAGTTWDSAPTAADTPWG